MQDFSIEDGQVRVKLDGILDVEGLSRKLRERGYYVANDPADVDSQGWGQDRSLEGYYPYWVFRDGDQWVFAFTPEDQHREGQGRFTQEMGPMAEEELNRWVPFLKESFH